MRRLVAGLAFVPLLAGCGAGHAEHTTTSARPRFHFGPAYAVQVYFCTDDLCTKGTTKSEERVVRTGLQHEQCVRRVVFISKAKALAQMSKHLGAKNGGLPPGMKNPLPDSYRVFPDKPSCPPEIAAAARAAHWRGVQKISVKRRVTRVGS